MKFCPHDYQTRAIERIKEQKRVGLWLGMGYGKTAITLTAIKDLFDDMAVSRVLVIAPLSVAETVWSDEAQKWEHLNGLRIERVLGAEKARRAALARDADIYVINRENVVWLVSEGLFDFDCVVIDELTSFKNSASKRFKALKKVIGRSDRVIGLTGTPAPNGLVDVWAQTYLIDSGHALGRTMTIYRSWYFHPGRQNGHVVYDWALNPGADKEIYEALKPVYYSAEDRIRVDRIDIDRYCEIDTEQYIRYKKELLLTIDGEDIPAATAAALVGKLGQMANGAIYDTAGTAHEIDTAKLDLLSEVIDEADDNVIIFYKYRFDAERIKARFPDAEYLTGEDSVRRWNGRKTRVLLAHPASAGYGLNLQDGGSIIVWFGLPWSLELYQQANARLARQGQTRPVRIVHLLAKGTVDEDTRKALDRKDTGQKALLDALKKD